MTIQANHSFEEELRRAEDMPVLRLAKRKKPVLRWRIDVSDGRLQCRWKLRHEGRV